MSQDEQKEKNKEKKPKTLGGLLTRGAAIVGVGLFANSMTYTVGENEQAVVTRLGDPVKIIVGSDTHGISDTSRVEELVAWDNAQEVPVGNIVSGAGIYFKRPLVDTVKIFPDTMLEYDSAPTETVTADKKRLEIDMYARWQIENPLLFLKTATNVNGGRERLADIIYSIAKQETGKVDLVEIVRNTNEGLQGIEGRPVENIEYGREEITGEITQIADDLAAEYGISIADVRIKRADLPEVNAESVFNRMRAERERIAKEYRSLGEEEATKIRAEANKERDIILADAYNTSQRIRGDGDALALQTYASAYSQNPDLFRLTETLDMYTGAFDGEGPLPKVVLPLESEAMKYLSGTRN